jgi:hypothetical protein
MSHLKIATAAASLALIASPCLAFTFSPAPVDSSGRSMLADPDARLESTTSQMRDAYIQNNGGGSDAAAVRFSGGAAGQASDPSANFGSILAGTPVSDQSGVWAEGHTAASSAPTLGAQGGR